MIGLFTRQIFLYCFPCKLVVREFCHETRFLKFWKWCEEFHSHENSTAYIECTIALPYRLDFFSHLPFTSKEEKEKLRSLLALRIDRKKLIDQKTYRIVASEREKGWKILHLLLKVTLLLARQDISETILRVRILPIARISRAFPSSSWERQRHERESQEYAEEVRSVTGSGILSLC